MKKYVLFVISDEPLDLSEAKIKRLTESKKTHHFIYEEVELEQNGDGKIKIEKGLNHHSMSERQILVAKGVGETVSNVVVNFLKSIVVDIFGYKPLYKRTDVEREEVCSQAMKTDI